MQEFFNSIVNFFATFLSGTGLSIVKALAVLVVGLIVTSLVVGLVRSIVIKKSKMDNAAAAFVTSLAKVVLYILTAILVLSTAGVDTASLIAAFAAVALAISLGLQDTLSGLTNGILIIFTKPFKQGDYVSVGGTEGTVKEIRLFNTKLTTPDNLDVIVPNSKILSADVINYSAMPLRRIDIFVPIAYEEDMEKIKDIILSCLTEDNRVVEIPTAMCRIWSYGERAVEYLARCWVPNAVFWDVKFDLNERIFQRLRDNGIEMPVKRTDVKIIADKGVTVMGEEGENNA